MHSMQKDYIDNTAEVVNRFKALFNLESLFITTSAYNMFMSHHEICYTINKSPHREYYSMGLTEYFSQIFNLYFKVSHISLWTRQ